MILMKFSQIISKKLICFKHGQHSKIYCVIKFLCQALLWSILKIQIMDLIINSKFGQFIRIKQISFLHGQHSKICLRIKFLCRALQPMIKTINKHKLI